MRSQLFGMTRWKLSILPLLTGSLASVLTIPKIVGFAFWKFWFDV
jgi:hypothetical protein